MPLKLRSNRAYFSSQLALLLSGVIIVALSVPVTHDILSAYRVRQTAQILAADLKCLSIAADQRGGRLRVNFNGHGYVARDLDGKIQSERTFSKWVMIKAPLAGFIDFHARGIASPSTLLVSDDVNACTVTVSIRSRIKMRCV